MKERILRHLLEHGSITTWETVKEFGTTRLSHYIWLLKRDGYKFSEEIISTTNRYGDKVHYKRYYLEIN